MLRLVLHVLIGLITAAIVLPFSSQKTVTSITKVWCGQLLRCLNISVITSGNLPNSETQRTMFIANHVSWVDIHAINSIIPLRFIAKAEIKDWPIFGYLVRKSGTLFIDRSRKKDAMRIIDVAANSLKNNDNVGLFPEGKTTVGDHVSPFKGSIIQAAIQTDALVWPVRIFYPKPDGSPNIEMSFAGETTMAESMLNILRLKHPVVELHFLAPIVSTGNTRHYITQKSFDAINESRSA